MKSIVVPITRSIVLEENEQRTAAIQVDECDGEIGLDVLSPDGGAGAFLTISQAEIFVATLKLAITHARAKKNHDK